MLEEVAPLLAEVNCDAGAVLVPPRVVAVAGVLSINEGVAAVLLAQQRLEVGRPKSLRATIQCYTNKTK